MSDGDFQRRLGYAFRDPRVLETALTHRSRSPIHNERLEFLGDAILNFVVAEYLYLRFAGASEGALSRMRATLVRKETLARCARDLDIGAHMHLGGGELKSGGQVRESILADAMEAVVGAIYLDGGIERCRDFVLERLRDSLAGVDPAHILKDPKSRLQEFLQQRGRGVPRYDIVEVHGEPHRQHFVVECAVEGLSGTFRGAAGSRRGAEQEAAERALVALSRET